MSKSQTKAVETKIEQTASTEKPTVTNRILKDNVDIKGLYEEHKTHSAVIRVLNSKGYTRSEISKALGKRYQHVRNVLTQDALKPVVETTK